MEIEEKTTLTKPKDYKSIRININYSIRNYQIKKMLIDIHSYEIL